MRVPPVAPVAESPELTRAMELVRLGDAEMPSSALLEQILEADGSAPGRAPTAAAAPSGRQPLQPVTSKQKQWGMK